MRQTTSFLSAALLGLSFVRSAIAEDAALRVTADLVDGRQLSGHLAGADISGVDLVGHEHGIELVSHLSWQQVTALSSAQEQLSLEQLRKLVPAAHPTRTGWLSQPPRVGQSRAEEPAHWSPVVPLKVEHLEIDAQLGNWDDDGALDGLLVAIYPLAATGETLAVDGDVQFTLAGNVVQRNSVPKTVGTPRELARRGFLVRRDHFRHGAAVYRLEFDGLPPPEAFLHHPCVTLRVRLGVQGQGAFDAEQDVQLVPVMWPH